MNNSKNSYNLFIYGSLRDPSILESVCGLSFTLKPSNVTNGVLLGELALLPNYRRVSPDNVYYYAIEDSKAKIEGIVLYGLSEEAMNDIDRYEGKFYDREDVTVTTANGPVEAKAYLASHKKMRQQFGDRFHVNLIHELWLRKRIARFFQRHTRPGEKTQEADIERRARRELLGTTERDLVISHLRSNVPSDYFLEHELERPIPSIRHLYSEPESRPFLENYIKLVIKHVILNQFEQTIQERLRYQLDHLLVSSRYYNRSISLLIALRMINTNTAAMESILKRSMRVAPLDGTNDLIDYVKYAIQAADSAYDHRVAESGIEWVRSNRQPGLIPIGAELEFSNLGFQAIAKSGVQDSEFNGFRYFNDFALHELAWKMGGYIDDHRGTDKLERKSGFLELAPGRLNIRGEISKPATCDPWIMNQLIVNISEFYPIKPHSLHLTFQLRRRQINHHKILPIGFVKCLLALGGGPQTTTEGKLFISRMNHDEIQQDIFGEEFIFARTSKRKSHLAVDDYGPSSARRSHETYTQQYKFIRLDPRANYEALIMALKGLQLEYNPGDYLTAKQLRADRRLRYNYDKLKEWSENPSEINRQTISYFLKTIKLGLMKEHHRKPEHKLHYIEWALGAIDVQLRLFNKQIQRNDPYYTYRPLQTKLS